MLGGVCSDGCGREVVSEMGWLGPTRHLWRSGLEVPPYARFHQAHTHLYSICLNYLEMVRTYTSHTQPVVATAPLHVLSAIT